MKNTLSGVVETREGHVVEVVGVAHEDIGALLNWAKCRRKIRKAYFKILRRKKPRQIYNYWRKTSVVILNVTGSFS